MSDNARPKALQRTPINREHAVAPLGSRAVRVNWLTTPAADRPACPVSCVCGLWFPAAVAEKGRS